ncbi:ribosomal-processing cysteine protease Prp [Anaeromicropila herbilytica]|uniref:Ribosomal processing cysteine protease Prp n=1 Tax=Anaeromicropila herbilytica TaxID=2785025 RepID=A0A7R7EL13_9FIRM|nr:ribosomal-processing cysteine protease Prp [Anaeromicropila herbilytica]BCN30703.1 hypothetical protein bsdtb5_19980 [Anaeromicropila herbilytica]
MIKVSIFKNADGIYTGLRALGHAGFADHGEDIVCSAVSILVINTVNSIEQFTSDKFDIKTDEESGLIELKFSSPVSKEATLLLDSLVLGLKGVESGYGNEFIKLSI